MLYQTDINAQLGVLNSSIVDTRFVSDSLQYGALILDSFRGSRQPGNDQRRRFSYDKRRPILSGIDMVIPRGKVVAIMGISGSGKTTLLRLIGGVLKSNTFIFFFFGSVGLAFVDGCSRGSAWDTDRARLSACGSAT